MSQTLTPITTNREFISVLFKMRISAKADQQVASKVVIDVLPTADQADKTHDELVVAGYNAFAAAGGTAEELESSIRAAIAEAGGTTTEAPVKDPTDLTGNADENLDNPKVNADIKTSEVGLPSKDLNLMLDTVLGFIDVHAEQSKSARITHLYYDHKPFDAGENYKLPVSQTTEHIQEYKSKLVEGDANLAAFEKALQATSNKEIQFDVRRPKAGNIGREMGSQISYIDSTDGTDKQTSIIVKKADMFKELYSKFAGQIATTDKTAGAEISKINRRDKQTPGAAAVETTLQPVVKYKNKQALIAAGKVTEIEVKVAGKTKEQKVSLDHSFQVKSNVKDPKTDQPRKRTVWLKGTFPNYPIWERTDVKFLEIFGDKNNPDVIPELDDAAKRNQAKNMLRTVYHNITNPDAAATMTKEMVALQQEIKAIIDGGQNTAVEETDASDI